MNLASRLALVICSMFFLSLLGIGCSSDYTNSIEPTVILPHSTPTAMTITPSPKPANTKSAPPTTTPKPIPSPTSTPLPVVSVYAPPDMISGLNEAVRQLELGASDWQWSLAPSSEGADLSLVEGEAGIPAGARPIALTVPFTSDWEEVSYEDAQQLLSGENDFVLVFNWAEMPANRKALRVDGHRPWEPGYPLQQNWSLIAKSGFEAAANELSNNLASAISYDQVISLTAVGDIMLDRALGNAIAGGSIDYPFALLSEQLAWADITVGNMESALGDRGQPAAKSYTFQAPPAAAGSLARAGFDVISLANNHAMDFGSEALIQAINLLQQQEIAPIGAGQDVEAAHSGFTALINGLTISFLGYVNVPVEVTGFDTKSWTATESQPGLAWAEPALIMADVAESIAQSDLTIVVLHSGYEYIDVPSPDQQAAARAAIDAGADLVIGHHAHILQGVEYYKDGVIVYGLGNFAFEIDGDPSTAILNVWLDEEGVRQLEFIPAIIQFGGQPRLAESWEQPAILNQVYRLTNSLNVE